MKNLMFTVLLAIAIHAYAEEAKQKLQSEKPSETTLMALAAHPDMFHQKRVSVYGYVKLEAENYSSSTLGCGPKSPKQENNVWLQLAPPKAEYKTEADAEDFYLALKKYARFRNSCAWVTGTYDKTIKSGWGDFVGGIKDISAMAKKKP